MHAIRLSPRRWGVATLAAASAIAVTTVPSPGAHAEPSGARPAPEPDVAALVGPLADQGISWHPCLFLKPEDTPANLHCADVVVPADWRDPRNGKTLTIEISELRNLERTDPAYRGTLFANPGGPGVNGVIMSTLLKDRAPRLARTHNFLGFEPRGTGEASTALCDVTLDLGTTDPLVNIRNIGEACSVDPDVKAINSVQTAYDMDFIRHLLGLRQIDYLGFSYGTWLGSTYQRLFPSRADKFVLDSATDVTQSSLESAWLNQPMARDRQFFYRLTGYLARQDALYGLGTDRAQIYQRYLDALKVIDPETFSLAWLKGKAIDAFAKNQFYPDQAAAVAAIITTVESKTLPADPAAAAAVILQEAASLPPRARVTSSAELRSIAHDLETVSKLSASDGPVVTAPFTRPFDFIRCNDGQWTQGADFWLARDKRLSTEAPVSWNLGQVEFPLCAFWKASSAMPPIPRGTYPDTVVLQAELDTQTYFEGGRNSGTKMPNTRAILVDNEGTHALFPYGTACVDDPIYAFFERGVKPRKDVTVCQGKPLPNETKTYETWTKLTSRGQTTTPVESAFVQAATPRRTGRSGDESGALVGADLTAERSQVASLVRARYGAKAVKILDLEDAVPARGTH